MGGAESVVPTHVVLKINLEVIGGGGEAGLELKISDVSLALNPVGTAERQDT